MKTPEQVAEEVWGEGTGFHRGSGPAIVEMMTAAIEADREQRAARLEDLHAYDYFQMDEDEGREERIGIVQIDTTPGIGRLRVYINDGRIFDGDPETGQEWSLT